MPEAGAPPPRFARSPPPAGEERRARYLPVKLGFRFSTKAAMPSF